MECKLDGRPSLLPQKSLRLKGGGMTRFVDTVNRMHHIYQAQAPMSIFQIIFRVPFRILRPSSSSNSLLPSSASAGAATADSSAAAANGDSGHGSPGGGRARSVGWRTRRAPSPRAAAAAAELKMELEPLASAAEGEEELPVPAAKLTSPPGHLAVRVIEHLAATSASPGKLPEVSAAAQTTVFSSL